MGIIKKKNIVKEVVEAVKTIVRAEIRAALSEQELAQMSAAMQSATANLALYSRLKKRTRNKLNAILLDILKDTGYLAQRANDFTFMGAHLMAGAFSIRLIALTGLYRQTKDKGFKETAIEEINSYSKALGSIIDDFEKVTKLRIESQMSHA